MKPFAPKLSSHIPSLDGLRAISILLVLVGHMDGTRNFPFHTEAVLGDIANLGVRVFFVISGFLITTLLLKEFDRTGRISLSNFYVRRTLRIFPAFYAYALCVTAATLAGWIHPLPGDLLHAFTYTMNYHTPHGWYTGHIWSLSVEEQFYLLWPFTLLLAGPLRGRWISLLAIVVPPVLRIGSWFLYRNQVNTTEFPLIADAIACGCLLAGIFNLLGESPRYLAFLGSYRFLLVVALGIGAFVTATSTRFYYLFGMTILNVCVALCIDRCVRFPSGPVGKVLNWGPLRSIGLLSYSLYLWQQPFLNRHSAAWITAFPLNLMLAALCALGSYFLIERPIREYGYRRLSNRAASVRAAA